MVSPISKVEATKTLWCGCLSCQGVYDDASSKACELQQESGSTLSIRLMMKMWIAGQGRSV